MRLAEMRLRHNESETTAVIDSMPVIGSSGSKFRTACRTAADRGNGFDLVLTRTETMSDSVGTWRNDQKTVGYGFLSRAFSLRSAITPMMVARGNQSVPSTVMCLPIGSSLGKNVRTKA